MNSDDRQTVIHNLQQVIERTNIDTLVSKLVEKNIFTEKKVGKYLNENLLESQRKQELFINLRNKGPSACEKFVEVLIETSHYDLATQLKPTADPQVHLTSKIGSDMGLKSAKHGSETMTLPNYLRIGDQNLATYIQNMALENSSANINFSTEPTVIAVKQAVTRMDVPSANNNLLRVYPMGSRPKGYFMIISNIRFQNDRIVERKGAEVDHINLIALFEGLGYEVIALKDQGAADMKQNIHNFATMREHTKLSSVVMAILSHGGHNTGKEATHIMAADGIDLPVEWVLGQFTGREGSTTKNIPKIFFFQCCRGYDMDSGAWGQRGGGARIAVDSGPATHQPWERNFSDMLIAHSTVPGYVSHRDIHLGTWFIQNLCEVFMKHACDTNIEDMLKMVDEKLSRLRSDSGRVQTSCYEARGFGKFFFNPGLFDDTDPIPLF